jgi:hypothetical protein
MKTLRSIPFIAFVLSMVDVPVFAEVATTIEEALNKGMIKLMIKSKGEFTGKVIEMNVENRTSAALRLAVEAGRRLDSKAEEQQDILVTKQEELIVSAGQNKSFDIYGMCCQAHNACPKVNAEFSPGKMADSLLVRLARYIDKNKYYGNYTAQQAVWVVSDGNSLGSIDWETRADKELVTFVSTITGKKIPPYRVRYGNGNDHDLLGTPTKVEGVFEYRIPVNAHAGIAIYNSEGKLVQVLFKDLAHSKGEHKLYYTFFTRNLPSGKYYARMEMDGVVHKEELIEI